MILSIMDMKMFTEDFMICAHSYLCLFILWNPLAPNLLADGS